ncbi:hypothetical protein [Alkaliphilus peptidifermentans]|nr:hypothetical protein [Alkaliphilus peptidifermentans]
MIGGKILGLHCHNTRSMGKNEKGLRMDIMKKDKLDELGYNKGELHT